MSSSAISMEYVEAAKGLVQSAERLVLYRNILRMPPVHHLLEWAQAVIEGSQEAEAARNNFLAAVAQAQVAPETLPPLPGTTFWQSLILQAVLFDENPFTLMSESVGAEAPSGLAKLASADLRALQTLYNAPQVLGTTLDPLGILNGSAPLSFSTPNPLTPVRREMAELLASEADWGERVLNIARWVQRVGAGELGRYLAFRWHSSPDGGKLRPVLRPDLVDPDLLVAYEEERSLVFRNTEKFVTGLPAQNVLLYGDRGTGKSATVKAALYKYASQGLRLVEVRRTALSDIATILQLLAHRACRFILFIDDLSFDEADVAYKELKAVLEGTLEGRPQNVLIYATSNRRHLIKEYFSDRQRASDDVNPRDTLEEKLSLADRFGLTVIFPAPDQERFLEIVRGIAQQRGIKMAGDELERKALQWVVWNNGRSPRSAQQFIDYVASEESLE